ncbi:MAG: Rieske (2Fe-2S) protein [Bryobacteraceae bacterium]|nr:Rieske (2Fe-2S) protein [Bryobacteraceae bacterium]
MALLPAIAVEEVPHGSVREVTLNGRSYAICNTEGAYFAVSGDCPHRNGPLGHGAVHGYWLVCPWHLWEFDVRNGSSSMSPDCAIATYPIEVADGIIRIDVP